MAQHYQLIVGRDSTWSLRAYLCMQLAELEFSCNAIALGEAGYQQQLAKLSPSKLVPVLHVDDLVIHDSLAISEYINEQALGKLYPVQADLRAQARSYLAELHAGFTAIRQGLPFHFEKQARPASLSAEINTEIARLSEIWQQFDGCFAFNKAGSIDAFYVVMALRLANYGIELEGAAGRYQQHLISWPLFQRAINSAKQW
ncbi:glutathione S-transferase [Agarivorans sp. B2Z047]|uniref:glutathione S-transferase N-terminal domain-containing protein n=1 Tax=Agarivorans sp. B2Z047 TaxID=2652721 RepID=UPI00128CD2C8|nr:glutathione S-transferase N-terminal domain-containing protein [Agarivorans sp. B2Z047]MPW30341.1 glutathione S-transferase [Agarivorans sp. B2Z047]UQN43030.1 glutathione S-transferase N-terminal domain-containing protein [Agarivorans sp. B2Z047]